MKNLTQNEIVVRVDSFMDRAAKRLRPGYLSNAEIIDSVRVSWDIELPYLTPSCTRIGQSLSRLGYKKWRTAKERGWVI